jgi:hypothetical protein
MQLIYKQELVTAKGGNYLAFHATMSLLVVELIELIQIHLCIVATA